MHWLSPLIVRLVLLVPLILVVGCTRGPDAVRLEHDLQDRLDSQFQQGLFSVRKFRRSGSAPFRDLETGVAGVYVYFDAELELEQDYSLTNWQGLNLGTLAYAIGATESGVEGFRSNGNVRGDLLQVHGRLAYEPNGEGGWESLDELSAPAPAEPVEIAVETHGRSPESVLKDARALLTGSEESGKTARSALIIDELDQAVDRIDLGMASLEGKITLGTGSAPGTYYSFGQALSNYCDQIGVPLYSSASEGSVANANGLQSGDLDFGLVQSDVAQLLYQGWVREGVFPYGDLRTVASLWPEAVHLLTLEGSGITQLSDLKGRRVAIGQRGSGSRVNALLIGLAAQADTERLPTILEISLSKAIAQLEARTIDALFLTEAVPARSIQALAARRDDLRFISMPEDLFAKLSERGFVYYPLTVEAKTYPNQKEAFTTLGLAAALLTHRGVAAERVDEMLNLLLSGGDELARRYYRAAFISRDTMRLDLSVPLHPAAERFYDRYDRRAR